MNQPPPCGEVRAAWNHRRHGEQLDDACRLAANEYNRELRKHGARRRSARLEAMEALAWRHPAEFAELLKKALADRG